MNWVIERRTLPYYFADTCSGFYFGIMKGIIRQFFGLLALFLGMYCAFKFSQWTGTYIAQWFHTGKAVTQGIAFALTLIIVVVALILVGRFATRLISLAALGFVDKILGELFGILKIACILLRIALHCTAIRRTASFFIEQHKAIILLPMLRYHYQNGVSVFEELN